MYTEELDVSRFADFDHHERVVGCIDEDSGLRAFIAIHNRALGPALGGCRMWPYPAEDDAIKDVLRLSRGMTYKSAISGLPLGGGKAVIVGDPSKHKTTSLMEAMGRFVDFFDGTYITAEDSGTSVEDLICMATQTPYVAGIHKRRLSDGREVNGDPSPSTAYGVFKGIEAAVRFAHGTTSLAGLRVAVQGVGHVGRNLACLLTGAGASLTISDIHPSRIEAALAETPATVVDAAAIHRQDVDVFAPCALGGVICLDSLPEIKAPIIAGAANNQLANAPAGFDLFARGKLFAPDYVINAGGIIDIYYEREGYDHPKVLHHIERIGDTLDRIFAMSKSEREPTHVMADRLARERLLKRSVSRVA